MDTRKVGRRFYKTYRKEDGGLFRGLIGKPPLTGRYTNYVVGGLMLFTGPNTNVGVGDIFFNQFGRAVLVMDNADEESLGATQHCYTLKLMNRTMNWVREIKQIDPISGLETSVHSFENLGKVYVSFEDDGKTKDTLQVEFPKYTIISNKPFVAGDYLEDENGIRYVVTRRDDYVGVTISRVRKC